MGGARMYGKHFRELSGSVEEMGKMLQALDRFPEAERRQGKIELLQGAWKYFKEKEDNQPMRLFILAAIREIALGDRGGIYSLKTNKFHDE